MLWTTLLFQHQSWQRIIQPAQIVSENFIEKLLLLFAQPFSPLLFFSCFHEICPVSFSHLFKLFFLPLERLFFNGLWYLPVVSLYPKKEVIQCSKRRFNIQLSQYLIGVILSRLHNWPYTLLVRMNLLIPLGRDHWIPQIHYFKYSSNTPPKNPSHSLWIIAARGIRTFGKTSNPSPD